MFLAMFIRIALLFAITWGMGLTARLVTLFGRDHWAGPDFIGGGLFRSRRARTRSTEARRR
jgi:hypothetical protein